MQTYNPKKISMSFGTHMPTGYADDSFVSIEPNGDGITKKVGCDGEIVRSVSPDDTYDMAPEQGKCRHQQWEWNVPDPDQGSVWNHGFQSGTGVGVKARPERLRERIE